MAGFEDYSRIEKKTQIKWLKYLSQIDERTQTVDPELTTDPEIAAALEMVKVAALSAEDIEKYHDREDKARLEATVIEDARREGEAKGAERGKAQGLAEGGHSARLAIAKNLLKAGMAVNSIAAATQLSLVEIEQLQA